MPTFDRHRGAGRFDARHAGLGEYVSSAEIESFESSPESKLYGVDLKLQNDDLVIGDDGDVKLLGGIDCLNQDLLDAFRTQYYFWGLTHQFGSRLQEFVEGGTDIFYQVDVKRAVAEVLRAEARVIRDSWKIMLTKAAEGVEVILSYVPIQKTTPETIKLIVGS